VNSSDTAGSEKVKYGFNRGADGTKIVSEQIIFGHSCIEDD
jgi:hypothetical protein